METAVAIAVETAAAIDTETAAEIEVEAEIDVGVEGGVRGLVRQIEVDSTRAAMHQSPGHGRAHGPDPTHARDPIEHLAGQYTPKARGMIMSAVCAMSRQPHLLPAPACCRAAFPWPGGSESRAGMRHLRNATSTLMARHQRQVVDG